MENKMFEMLLESLKDPFVFVDKEHIIRFANSKGKKHYAKFGDFVGKSIFDCHNEQSSKAIRNIFEKLSAGKEEVLFENKNGRRLYMRGVFNEDGTLEGYYERYEFVSNEAREDSKPQE